nr:hypothetical protein CFP56_72978 [Quercus suber]
MKRSFTLESTLRTEVIAYNFRFIRLAFEGRESDPTLYGRVLTLLGTLKLQMPFHILLVSEKSEDDGGSFNSSSIRSLYPDLIEYVPSGL